MTLTFRDTIKKISPPWLQNGLAEKILYTFGAHLDTFGDALVAGVKMRFPGLYTNESLAIVGRERRIRRGRTEDDSVYATRLLRWLGDHRRRGGPYALLLQLFAHFAPANFTIQLIYRSGRRYTMDVNGAITRDDIAFNPDSTPTRWAQWWLIYTWPDGLQNEIWGSSGNWGPDHVWGSNLTPQDVTDLRLIPNEWNNAHCFGHIILLSGDARLWGYPPHVWGGPHVWGSGAVVELAV